ncbi:MAG: phospholipase, partial [Gemmatimonadota bacterium]|nr:phospholipase [Gemmatimonadota bacterium]
MNSMREGASPGEAGSAVVLVHGRGGSPEDMLGLAGVILDALGDAPGREALAWEALRAPGGSWYPHGFMEPLERNRPWLDRSLEALEVTIADLAGEGIPERRIGLLGFSQGA